MSRASGTFIRYIKNKLLSMLLNDSEELIFTIDGVFPRSQLRYETQWGENEKAIFFIERFWLNGTKVKESTHMLGKQGLVAHVQTGGLH